MTTNEESRRPSDKDFIEGEVTKAVINRDTLSSMVSADFQIRGFIPFNVYLFVEEIEQLDNDYLELTMTVSKESVN